MRHRPNKTQNLGHPPVPIAAAVFAIVLCVGAQERPPNTIPPGSSEAGSGISKLNAGQKAGESKQTGPAEPQILRCDQTSPCYVIEEPQAKSKEQQAKDDSLDMLYRRYMKATIFGVIGAFIGIGILIWQTIMSRTAANAAKASADATIIGERAWIVLDLVPMAAMYGKWWHRLEPYGPVSMSEEEVLAGHHLRHKLRLKNIGKSPAHILGFQIDYSVVPDEVPSSAQSEVPADARVYDFWLVPNQEETVEPIVDIAQHTNVLIKEVGDAKKSVLLRIKGWVKYRHIFSATDASEIAEFEYIYSSATGSVNKARIGKAEKEQENPH